MIDEYQTKYFEIFCEGEWEQSQQLTRIFDGDSNAAISQQLIDLDQTGLVSLIGHIGSVDRNSSVDPNGLVGRNDLCNHNGLVEHDDNINPNGPACKLIVICNWTKISLIFQEDCTIFCEGEWSPTITKMHGDFAYLFNVLFFKLSELILTTQMKCKCNEAKM